ncbi:hypothetical protein [Thermotomaculum hydrothermale]|uniref:hypothetical protein n=1 Tax=Thermotomaculum hydrothermale TaxID=981385 RepID=UPI001915778E|nr:hypothetical protein [Thermotomaculum hydrothermale]
MIENLLKELEYKLNAVIDQNGKLKQEVESLRSEVERLRIENGEMLKKIEILKNAEKTVEGLIEKVNRLIEN